VLMGAPGPIGDAPLMRSREVSLFSHQAKRLLLSHPGKPLRRIRLKREPTFLGTDDDIASVLAILDARDDMDRLARCCGGGTRAGSRRRRSGRTRARFAWPGPRRRSDWLGSRLLELA